MPLDNPHPLRRAAVPVAAIGIVLLTGFNVRAQESDFWDTLFGGGQRAAPPAPTYQRSYDRRDTRGTRGRDVRNADRRDTQTRGKGEAKPGTVRFVSLQKAAPFQGLAALPGIKQPVDQKAIAKDPGGAILKDRTLRAGDIVVMPDGPKVFRGVAGRLHKPSDFEDVKRSHYVDSGTRKKLLAMMTPIGAMPADAARKVMAVKLKLAPPEEIEASEAEARNEPKPEIATPRVIVPWANPR